MIGWLGEQTGDIKIYIEREEVEYVRNHGDVQGEVLRIGTPGKKRKATFYFDSGDGGKSFVGTAKPEELVTIHLSERDYKKLCEENRIDFYDPDTRNNVHVTIADATHDIGDYEAIKIVLQDSSF
ncbi:MAG TPA: hypothetical protein VJH90_03485 [archaeon]|nr:hypothetical protein [archaeon]